MPSRPAPWIVQQIESWASTTPTAPAVIDEHGTTTYALLWRRANDVALCLQDAGLVGGELVAGAAPRGASFVAAALGTWLAGAAYVPLDMMNPSARLRRIVNDAEPAILLTSAAYRGSGAALGVPEMAIPSDGSQDRRPRPADREADERAAYVIYTSGTTGAPKGVVVGHGSVANLSRWFAATYAITPADRILHTASLGFDASVLETYPYLAAGACVVACSDEDRMFPEAMAAQCTRHGCTNIFVPTALCEHALAVGFSPPGLRYLITGGDRLRLPRPAPRSFRLINVYGPTESTVAATMHDVVEGGPGDTPPIGRPVGGVTVLVCDSSGAEIPHGEIGELYIGGASLAHGYLRRPELTDERFVALPDRGGRWYRTGDLVQWSDGVMLFHGRVDREQLKVRGARVEAIEIETALLGVDGITGAAVTTVRADDGPSPGATESTLVALLTTGTPVAARKIRRELVTKLPGYLIPEQFVVVDRLPLTTNGKLDRAAVARLAQEHRVQVPAAGR